MAGRHAPGNWWRASKSISGGILYDWGAHLLEYSMQLLDGDLVEVSAFAHRGYWAPKTRWREDTNEDEMFLTARFSSGQWLTLCISHLDSHPKPGILEITGTEGTYVLDHGTYELVRHKGRTSTTVRGQNRPATHAHFYREVASHLVKGDPLTITAEWARRPIHIMDLANRSVALGRAVRARYG